MAQAETITTTSRTGPAPRPQLPKPVDPLKLAHGTLIFALLRERVQEISGCWAHPSEIRDLADHLEQIYKHVNDYADVLTRHAADFSNVDRTLIGGLRDAAGDLVGGLRFAAEQPEGA